MIREIILTILITITVLGGWDWFAYVIKNISKSSYFSSRVWFASLLTGMVLIYYCLNGFEFY